MKLDWFDSFLLALCLLGLGSIFTILFLKAWALFGIVAVAIPVVIIITTIIVHQWGYKLL
jgi:multidrug efflux pump subunit AcrB